MKSHRFDPSLDGWKSHQRACEQLAQIYRSSKLLEPALSLISGCKAPMHYRETNWRQTLEEIRLERENLNLEEDLIEQWERAQLQIFKLCQIGIKIAAGMDYEERIRKGTIVAYLTAIKLRHLLDHGITRFARRCFGTPNKKFIPQTVFPQCKAHLKGFPYVGPSETWTGLSHYPAAEELLNEIVDCDWLKQLIELTNKAKHARIAMPPVIRRITPEHSVHILVEELWRPAVPFLNGVADNVFKILQDLGAEVPTTP